MWELEVSDNSVLSDSIESLPGIGLKRAIALKERGITTIADLLACVPYKYIHRSSAIPIAEIPDDDTVTVSATIKSAKAYNRKLFVEFEDETGTAKAIFFNPPVYFKQTFVKGARILLWGNAKLENGRAILFHPDIEIEGDDRETLIPIYPNSSFFKEVGIGRRTRTKIVESAMKSVEHFDDPIPEEILNEVGLIDLDRAVRQIHKPSNWLEVEETKKRFAFDELLLQQIVFAQRKYIAQEDISALPLYPGKLFSAVKVSLPFELTEGQNKALASVIERATSQGRSLQLLSGDVGSGKTVIAALLAACAIDNGMQVSLIVPSTIVARQHAEFFHHILGRFGVKVGLLTGNSTSESLTKGISSGEVSIVIGTQALLSDKLRFKKLGLIILDEQQRFGVGQRLELPRRSSAHVLLMSATPIPRTLALAAFGDLDLQILEGFPKNRKGCRTFIRPESSRSAVWDFVENRIALGERAFIVYPRIEGEDSSALNSAQSLISDRFQGKIALANGSLSDEMNQSAFSAFRSGEKPILLATSIVEIGVDVPEASVMIIENPEVFGLAQLHQLRGRIGRGEHEGFCILISRSSNDSSAFGRLKLFSETKDGFKIAEIDLAIRREGNVLETAQSGKPIQNFADPFAMPEILNEARDLAEQIIKEDPFLEREKNFHLRKGTEYLLQSQNIVKLSV